MINFIYRSNQFQQLTSFINEATKLNNVDVNIDEIPIEIPNTQASHVRVWNIHNSISISTIRVFKFKILILFQFKYNYTKGTSTSDFNYNGNGIQCDCNAFRPVKFTPDTKSCSTSTNSLEKIIKTSSVSSVKSNIESKTLEKLNRSSQT